MKIEELGDAAQAYCDVDIDDLFENDLGDSLTLSKSKSKMQPSSKSRSRQPSNMTKEESIKKVKNIR